MNEPIDCRLASTRVLQSYRSRVDLFKRLIGSPHGFLSAHLVFAVAVFVAFSGSVNGLQAQTPQTTLPRSDLPDVIFILSDDQAWSDYSFMGHPHIRTPALDQLAQESQLFTRGYVPDSLCRPSLATIITGLYPHQHGIVGNDPPPSASNADGRMRAYKSAEYQKDIEQFLRLHIDQLTTLPDRLKPLGYTSFQSGKWWEGNPSRGGFDSGMTHGDHNRGGRHGDAGLDIGRKGMQPIEQFVSQSRKAEQPYFLWYAPFLPHAPHNPPEELLAHYRDLAPTESIAKYWAMCEWLDQTVGQLRTIVEERGRPDNTLIVYVCDNGWINLPDKSGYAPKSKRSQYDGGIRTPIMLHWPGHITPSRDDVHLASSIDLVPSTLALLGIAPDDSLPGIDLTDHAQVAGRDAVYGEIFEHDIQSMDDPLSSLCYRWVIEGYTKLIVPDLKQVPDGVPELYDLEHDPWEEYNLASEHAGEVQRLSDRLNAWWP